MTIAYPITNTMKKFISLLIIIESLILSEAGSIAASVPSAGDQSEKSSPGKVGFKGDPDASPENVRDLPLQIIKPGDGKSGNEAALIISGDGGWYSFEQSLASKLAEEGIPTIGLDSKKYFWDRKTPEQTAKDITDALTWYGKMWDKDRFILIGYSLGAEIVPFIVSRLPESLRTKVESSVLLSPGKSTDFEIHISNMIGIGNRQNTYNVPEEIRKMKPVRTLVIFGEGEKTQMPDLLAGSGVKIDMIPGDHHYKFNIPLIIKTMKVYNTF